MSTRADLDLDATFSALADPTRRAILTRLTRGEATVNELAEPFSLTLQAVSKHIKVLERCGLVSRRRDGQTRPCRLETEGLESAVGWIDQRHKAWDDRFNMLDEHLKSIDTNAGSAANVRRKQ